MHALLLITEQGVFLQGNENTLHCSHVDRLINLIESTCNFSVSIDDDIFSFRKRITFPFPRSNEIELSL